MPRIVNLLKLVTVVLISPIWWVCLLPQFMKRVENHVLALMWAWYKWTDEKLLVQPTPFGITNYFLTCQIFVLLASFQSTLFSDDRTTSKPLVMFLGTNMVRWKTYIIWLHDPLGQRLSPVWTTFRTNSWPSSDIGWLYVYITQCQLLTMAESRLKRCSSGQCYHAMYIST